MSGVGIRFSYVKTYIISVHFSSLIYRYENQLETFCKFMDPLLDSAPPESLQGVFSLKNQLKDRMHKSAFWARFLRQAMTLGQKDIV